MRLPIRRGLRSGILVAVLAAGLAIAVGSGVSAQSVVDVVVRDRLIADQENLLNTYRCLFGVDVEVVPGGCPNPDVVSPGASPQNPTQQDLDMRDGLIQRQEALLNVYRCRFNVDTEIVAGGCPDTGASQPTPEPGPTGGHQSVGGENNYDHLYHYVDVFPEEYTYPEERPIGPVFDSVNRLREMGVLEGTDCGEKRFCPDDSVDGDTFAVWLARILGESTGGTAGAVERLVELGIAAPCSGRPVALCPGEEVSRAKLATFVTRALDLPASEAIGFWDVEDDNEHLESIDRLVGSGLDDGCSELRFVPLHFCPDRRVSRGELAKLLSEIIDYIEARDFIGVNPDSVPDDSIGLSISYDEDEFATRITWSNPDSHRGKVFHYVVQWRPVWSDFNYQRYRVIEFKQRGKYSVEFLPPIAGNEIYSVRVIVAYDNDNRDRLASNELKVPSKHVRLHDLIETRMIDAHGDEQPWLVDTWRHLSNPNSGVHSGGAHNVSLASVYNSESRLEQTFATNVELGESVLRNPDRHLEKSGYGIVAHELAHAYTLTNGITKDEAPKSIGHLYLSLLVAGQQSQWCADDELYADLAMLAYSEAYSSFDPEVGLLPSPSLRTRMFYWSVCGLNLDQKTKEEVTEDVIDITKSVFIDQRIPQWFYDRYQLEDESINLDKLWADILGIGKGQSRSIIIYGLQNEFGGYCSKAKEKVYQLQAGEIETLETPWRDAGGCPDET